MKPVPPVTRDCIFEIPGRLDETGAEVRKVKARELAGGSDLLFIQNSATGRIECRTNRKAIELNEQLHAHN